MRPIKLTISGLNSYIETQTIDFSRLTERGLFGIFGPTGCGKSTILDAMILSLYGHKGIPRSTSEFINTAVDEASVGFLFGLDTDDGPRRLHVERKFKRTATGLSTSFSRLRVQTELGEVTEVWDRTTEVTQQVEAILGLTREDFMRSVVLPQGKFSEFLTLEGVSRRNMLERLLNLNAYGSQLQEKIKSRGDQLKSKMLKLEGEMKRFSELSPEQIEAAKDELAAAESEEKQLRLRLEALEGERGSKSRLMEIVKALETLHEKAQTLQSQKVQMQREKKTLELAFEAERIWPLLQQAEELDGLTSALKEKSSRESERFLELEALHQKSKTDYEIFDKDFKGSRDELAIRKAALEKAKVHAQKAQALSKEREALVQEYRALQKSMEEAEREIAELVQRADASDRGIADLERSKKESEVQAEIREMISTGAVHESRRIELEKTLNQLKGKWEETQTLSRDAQGSRNKRQVDIDALKVQTERLEVELEKTRRELNDLPPRAGELEIKLGRLGNELQTFEKNWNDKLKRQSTCLDLEARIQAVQKVKAERQQALEDLEKALERAKADEWKFWQGAVLAKLAENLSDDAACPLCGSSEHPHLYAETGPESSGDLSGLSESYRQGRLQLDEALGEEARLSERLGAEREALETLAEVTKERHEELARQIQNLEKEKSHLTDQSKQAEAAYEKQSSGLKEHLELFRKADQAQIQADQAIARLEAQAEALGVQIAKAAEEKSEHDHEAKSTLKKLEDRLNFVPDSFAACQAWLRDKDVRHREAERNLEVLRRRRETERAALETSNRKLGDLKVQAEKVQERGSGLKERIRTHESEVRAVAGDADIDALLNDTISTLKVLEEKHETLKGTLETSRRSKDESASRLESLKGQLSQALEQLVKAESAFEAQLTKTQLDSRAAIRDAYIPESDLKSRKSALEAFEEEVVLVSDRISELDKERNGRTLSESEWTAFLEALEEVKSTHKAVSDTRSALQIKLRSLESDLEAMKSLVQKHKRYEQVQDLISDLSDLVRGNKFVEYVALTHLSYIARDASVRLMDITNHRYSLELDAKGNFIICDHYNGGVKRDTKTLSGGETFLTALSLSLALSSQIQLKGRTSLEFFFLDEGFGTLDAELLDIVMTSLEKLFHEKLTVGIISHVDELKNRVPIRLTVMPAEAGLHGTRTTIEVT